MRAHVRNPAGLLLGQHAGRRLAPTIGVGHPAPVPGRSVFLAQTTPDVETESTLYKLEWKSGRSGVEKDQS
jgi:hypothetical protein